MLSEKRKDYLMAVLREQGQIVATTASHSLGVSEDTIRRDLREMARAGLLTRVHGGALPVSPALGDVKARTRISTDAKRAIGKAAAGMVKDGQVVFVDGGTSCTHLVRSLPATLRATIVTHSPSIAVELVDLPGIDVIMLGGRLFRHSVVGVGAATLAAIAQVRADLYFMGVTSIHPESGLGTGDYEEACIKRALAQSAAETVVLASPEKLGTAAPFQVLPLAAAGTMIVSSETSEASLARYRAACPALSIIVT
jgi:DeoR/GlpR family transcriptional regulator of sugar metabolism